MSELRIAVCWKWSAQRRTVDPLTGVVSPDRRSFGPSPADQAALELALRLSTDVTVICAGAEDVQSMLRDGVAAGASHAIRCPTSGDAGSAEVAECLAQAAAGVDVVLCGDYSTDRGSGSVPAFLAAHLGAAQALGCVQVHAGDGGLRVERRLDRGRRERLTVPFPAVVSVEGSVARLRRAPLASVLASREVQIEVGPAVVPADGLPMGEPRPFRPRNRHAAAGFVDQHDPLARVLEITQATVDRTPPRLVTLEPGAAADEIVQQLVVWGYIESVDG